MLQYQNLKCNFWTFCFFLSPFEDSEDSLEEDDYNSEEIVSTESLSVAKKSCLDLFFVDNLPKMSSFNERLQEKVEKWKDDMFIEWAK